MVRIPIDAGDFYSRVARGVVPGHTAVHKFGKNPDIDIASGFETVWNGGGTYPGHDATAAELVTLVSSDTDDDVAGTGALTVQIYGLDANWAEQTETVVLTGTTLADSVNTYIRINRMVVRSAGSGGVNAGTISCAQKTTTANVFAIMPIGYNQTMVAAYTIPLSKTGYLVGWYVGAAGVGGAADVGARVKARPDGEVFQVKEEVGLRGGGSSLVQRVYTIPKEAFAPKTDIVIEASTDTDDTEVVAGFDLLLIDNS